MNVWTKFLAKHFIYTTNVSYGGPDPPSVLTLGFFLAILALKFIPIYLYSSARVVLKVWDRAAKKRLCPH